MICSVITLCTQLVLKQYCAYDVQYVLLSYFAAMYLMYHDPFLLSCMPLYVLQPNMILPGLDAPVPPPEVVAKYTVQVSHGCYIGIASEQHLCKLLQCEAAAALA
jgi:hypothetical protein